MISEKKQLANRANALKSTGPKTLRGKSHSSRNSLKHGLFSRDLVIAEADKPIFSALYQELYKQLTPKTALQRVGFDGIVVCCWRCRSASCMETMRLQKLSAPSAEASVDADGQLANPSMLRWFGSGRRELNMGIRLLQQLRSDISDNGTVRDSWKEPISACFGPEFFAALREWTPINPSALQLANQLVAHAGSFDMPLPEEKSGTVYVSDPKQCQQMMLKLVDLYQSCLNSARRMADEGTLRGQEITAGVSLDFTRYFPEAMRNLEHAVEWFLWLKTVGL